MEYFIFANFYRAIISNTVSVLVQLKDVVGLAAVQSLKGNGLTAVVTGSNVDVFLFNQLIALVCILRIQSHLDCMVNCRFAVLGSDLGYLDPCGIFGGIGDDRIRTGCILGQQNCLLTAAIIGNVERRICFRSGILEICYDALDKGFPCADTLFAVHLKDVILGISVQTVKGHARASTNSFCINLCIGVTVPGEQSHRECGCALDIICDQHLADGDAVVDLLGVGDLSFAVCLYCRRCCRFGGIADTAV